MDHKAAEQLFLEQSRAYYRDMKSVADHAPDGHVLRLAETFAVTPCHQRNDQSQTCAEVARHHSVLRPDNICRNNLQEQIADHEKTETRHCPACHAKTRHRGDRSKEIVTYVVRRSTSMSSAETNCRTIRFAICVGKKPCRWDVGSGRIRRRTWILSRRTEKTRTVKASEKREAIRKLRGYLSYPTQSD